MIEITFDLEQRHIDKGQRYRPCNCPFALAIQNLFNCKRVNVGEYKFGVLLWNEKYIMGDMNDKFSPDITEKIRRFDETGNMEPATYTIKVTDDLEHYILERVNFKKV